jgi:predicted lipoprotein with Yx(FWY)xxD motif
VVALGVALAVALLALGALAGCSSSKDGADDAGQGGDTTSTTTATAAGSDTTLDTIPSGTATVDVSTTDLGPILVDLTGHTLYVFLDDTAGAPTCVDESCTKVWPPLVGSAIAVGTGVQARSGAFKLVPRPDGTQQLSVEGPPLYTYTGDAGPGETSGQGVNGRWFVVGVDGRPITG